MSRHLCSVVLVLALLSSPCLSIKTCHIFRKAHRPDASDEGVCQAKMEAKFKEGGAWSNHADQSKVIDTDSASNLEGAKDILKGALTALKPKQCTHLFLHFGGTQDDMLLGRGSGGLMKLSYADFKTLVASVWPASVPPNPHPAVDVYPTTCDFGPTDGRTQVVNQQDNRRFTLGKSEDAGSARVHAIGQGFVSTVTNKDDCKSVAFTANGPLSTLMTLKETCQSATGGTLSPLEATIQMHEIFKTCKLTTKYGVKDMTATEDPVLVVPSQKAICDVYKDDLTAADVEKDDTSLFKKLETWFTGLTPTPDEINLFVARMAKMANGGGKPTNVNGFGDLSILFKGHTKKLSEHLADIAPAQRAQKDIQDDRKALGKDITALFPKPEEIVAACTKVTALWTTYGVQGRSVFNPAHHTPAFLETQHRLRWIQRAALRS